ncbi:MAG TPA: hypothetical protein PKC28_14480, partial [Bdellovibrionales bacterium]|nr:hypothetical protein [Bdellovibrionales bacterium]
MSLWQVGMVTAFGRGETLALALQKNGFAVRVLDFTQAFAPEYQRGAGPFPIARTNQFPEHAVVTDELRILPRGLTLWLEKGPLELGGTMAEFFNGRHEIVRNLRGGQVFPEFKDDWLRRLLGFWTSPFDGESWSRGVRSDVFPFDSDLGVVPAGKEQAVLNFERFRTLGFDFVATDGLRDVQIESSRLTEIEFGARGQAL